MIIIDSNEVWLNFSNEEFEEFKYLSSSLLKDLCRAAHVYSKCIYMF